MITETFTEAMPLADVLVRGAHQTPDRIALAFPDETATYAQLLAGATEVARSLHALGVRRGDHLGLLMPNSPEYVHGLFGASLLGCTVVPLNARFRAAELSYVIDHAELVAILTSNRVEDHVDFAAVLAESLPSLAGSDARVPLDLAEAPRLRTIAMVRGPGRPGLLGQREFEAAAADVPVETIATLRASVRVRDHAMILYTSGTTAQPKGCLISHEAITRGCIGRLKEGIELPPHPVFWAPGPLYHISSLQVFLGSLGVGGTYATDVFFQAARAASLIRDYKVTSAWPWFPAVMQDLYAQSHFVAAELTHITSIMLIGPESLLRRVQADFPGALHLNACGMTESAGMYAQSARDDTAAQRATTGGVPVAGFEAKIIDPDTGREVPADMKGEILVRGYSLMDGYYRDPERTAEALDGDGWLHTGDLYARSESGHLTFHGRLKDMLKVGGENVPAIEVEAFLCSHPAVKLAEVIGRPDSRLDEVPVAFVELHPGNALSADELIDFCRGRIASFKIPRAVYFKQSHQWPVSTTKINKTKLRAELDAFAEPATTV